MNLRRSITLLLIGALTAGGAAAPGQAMPRKSSGKVKAKTTRQLKVSKDRRTRRHLPAQAFFGRLVAGGLFGAAPGGDEGGAPGSKAGTGTGTTSSGTGPAPGGSGAGSGSGSGSGSETDGGTVALGVRETETPDYTTTLSRSSVPAGSVLVQLQNTGEDPHNLRIMRSDGSATAAQFPTIAPGATSTRSVALGAGSYRLFCTLSEPESHDAAGMNATLSVTPAR